MEQALLIWNDVWQFLQTADRRTLGGLVIFVGGVILLIVLALSGERRHSRAPGHVKRKSKRNAEKILRELFGHGLLTNLEGKTKTSLRNQWAKFCLDMADSEPSKYDLVDGISHLLLQHMGAELDELQGGTDGDEDEESHGIECYCFPHSGNFFDILLKNVNGNKKFKAIEKDSHGFKLPREVEEEGTFAWGLPAEYVRRLLDNPSNSYDNDPQSEWNSLLGSITTAHNTGLKDTAGLISSIIDIFKD